MPVSEAPKKASKGAPASSPTKGKAGKGDKADKGKTKKDKGAAETSGKKEKGKESTGEKKPKSTAPKIQSRNLDGTTKTAEEMEEQRAALDAHLSKEEIEKKLRAANVEDDEEFHNSDLDIGDEDDDEEDRAMLASGALKFRCLVKDIKFEYKYSETHDLKLRFTFGAKEKGAGSKKSKKIGGKSVETKTLKKVSQADDIKLDDKQFKTDIVIAESELIERRFVAQIVMAKKGLVGGQDVIMGESDLNLLSLANGCIYQFMEIRSKQGVEVVGVLHFTAIFQQVSVLELDFSNWTGSQLRPMDKTGTSDPYVVCKLARPRFLSPVAMAKMRQSRKRVVVKSRIEYATLSPVWDGSFLQTMLYKGTTSELEDEVVEVLCYDWDAGPGKDELIGTSTVSLRGLFENEERIGKVSVSLGYQETTLRNEKATLYAGRIEGSIKMKHGSKYRQFGEVVAKDEEGTNLVVQLDFGKQFQHEALRATQSQQGVAINPYVRLDWGGVVQKTKIFFGEKDPKFDQTFYFPIGVVKLTKNELQEKGAIHISAFHFRGTQHDIPLGSATVELYQISSAPRDETGVKRFEDRIRISGPQSSGDLYAKVYFDPDLPDGINFERSGQKDLQQMQEIFRLREKRWRKAIEGVKNTLNADFKVSALDENLKSHFLPTYLCSLQMPTDIQVPKGEREWRNPDIFKFHTPFAIARAVRCLPWCREKLDGYLEDEDIWLTPNVFLDLKRGSPENHCLLLCSLFLGNGMDAYVCGGKTRTGHSHFWVMERRKNGDVRMWEPSHNRYVGLPDRWKGRKGNRLQELKAKKKKNRFIRTGSDDDSSSSEEDDKEKKKKKKKAAREAAEREGDEYVSSEEDDIQTTTGTSKTDPSTDISVNQETNYHQNLNETNQKNDAGFGIENNLTDNLVDKAAEEKQKRALEAAVSAKLEQLTKGQDNDDEQILFMAKDDLVKTDTYESFMKGNMVTDQNAAGDVNWRGFLGKPLNLKDEKSSGKKYSTVYLPYRTIEIVFNDQNLWANMKHTNPAKISYDLENSDLWKKFIDPTNGFDPYKGMPVRPFFEPKRIGNKEGKLLRDGKKLQVEEKQTLDAIQQAIIQYRKARKLPNIQFEKELNSVLISFLENSEMEQSTDVMSFGRLFTSRKQKFANQINNFIGSGMVFSGTAFHFCRSNANAVATRLLAATNYHKSTRLGSRLVVAVHMTSYPLGGISVNVYFGLIYPKASKNTKKEEFAEAEELSDSD